MTAPFDSNLPADLPVLVAESGPDRRSASKQNTGSVSSAALREERRALWKTIQEAGGIASWVRKELANKGVSTEGLDPSTLSDKQKGGFKEKKRAEAEARRALKRLAWHAYRETHITHLGNVYWDDDQSPDKLDPDRQEERAKDNQVSDLSSPEALANGLGVTISRLRWLTFHREVDTATHYRRWQIPKRDGSMRTITAPKKYLKAAQRWALRNVFDKLPVHGNSHGFLLGRSIVTNATVHAGADVIVKVDIKDFFPTITFRRVKGLLRKAGLSEGVSTLVALLSTESPREVIAHKGKTLHVAAGPRALPQGAPTSPAITNILCRRMDKRLSGLSRLLGMKYTRYADDLTFSYRSPSEGTPPKLPKSTKAAKEPKAPKEPKTAVTPALKATARANAPIGVLLRGVMTILRSEGFRVHTKKTKVMRSGARQAVTGLVVNHAKGAAPARVPRETIRKLRAAIHNRKRGSGAKGAESLAQLKGLAAFVYMADPVRGRLFLDEIATLESSALAPSAAEPSIKK